MSQQLPEQVERSIANEILEKTLIYTLHETEEFCLYNGGYFHRGSEPKNIIRSQINTIAKVTTVPAPNNTDKPYFLSISKRNTILEIIKSETFIKLDAFDNEIDVICCKNGLYKVSGFDKCLLPNPNRKDGSYHSDTPDKLVFGIKYFLTHDEYKKRFEESYKAFIQIPIIYDSNAKCLEIDQFLTDVFGFETVPLVYEMLAYFLMPHVKYQKAFILYGPPSTGKTTFYDLIKKFNNGLKYFSELRLQELGERFQMVNLMNKLVNYFDDLTEGHIGDSEGFRRIVTNNYLSSEVKHVEEHVQWRNRTKLIFSCNRLPKIKKTEGDAFFRRWVLIQCFNIFKDKDLMTQEDYDDPIIMEKDYDILEKMCVPSEFSGLMNKIIEAWIRLQSRGYFPKEWNNIEYIKGLWQMDINPIKLFVDECCIIGNVEQADYLTFWNVINRFREEHNAKPITKHSCTQWLQRIDGIKKKRKSGGEYYYNGIGIKDSVLERFGDPKEKKEVKGIEEFTEEQRGYLENNDDKKGYNEDYSDPGRF